MLCLPDFSNFPQIVPIVAQNCVANRLDFGARFGIDAMLGIATNEKITGIPI